MVHLFFLLVWFGVWVSEQIAYAKFGKEFSVLYSRLRMQRWVPGDANAMYTPRFENHIQTHTSMQGTVIEVNT